MKPFCILIVDDDSDLVISLKLFLEESGYEVITTGNGPDAMNLVNAGKPDLVILDVVMHGIDGFETLKQIRATSSIPVIMLSAKGSKFDKVEGLWLGADDYLTKPFNADELIARIESIRRRLDPGQESASDSIELRHLKLDVKKHRAIVDGKEVAFTRIEWLLLYELARNAGKLMFYEDLLTELWGPEYRTDIQVLRARVNRLRKKIEKDPRHPEIIRTVHMSGYMIDQ